MRRLVIDLDVIARNLNTMRSHCSGVKICGVVKADAYGHGMIPVAKKLQESGVDYLGVADIHEAIVLREHGISIPILAWLHDFDENFENAIELNIELGLANVSQLDHVAASAKKLGKTARIHLKVDTGLGRNGVSLSQWPHVLRAVKDLVDQNLIHVVGIFSHLSATSAEEDLQQIEFFEDALKAAKEASVNYEIRHLVASDGALNYPQAHYDMVRLGVSLYGLSPWTNHTSAEYGLTPAMTAIANVINVKGVPAGQGVSYGYLYRTAKATNLALVPVGYAEGLPRNASGKAQVAINSKLYDIMARIAMDQFVVDVDEDDVKPGDEVVIFGDPANGVPSADQLALAADTINYEIVTRMGGRFRREYLGSTN